MILILIIFNIYVNVICNYITHELNLYSILFLLINFLFYFNLLNSNVINAFFIMISLSVFLFKESYLIYIIAVITFIYYCNLSIKLYYNKKNNSVLESSIYFTCLLTSN